uniref:Fetuin B n=1 Tax=Mastacembelus armatus TaxID=205130 RepID=A0A3Q3MB46_9TELE
MKHCVLLSLLLALGCVHIHSAPVEGGNMEEGSCEDVSALGAAKLALTKINQAQQHDYIFSLLRLSNVHIEKHGDAGEVFYLTLDVVETNCSVLSKKDWKDCEARPTHDTPVYGQCKTIIYISKVQRVVRLYKFNCVFRPVPATRVSELCPDCSSLISKDNDNIKETVSLSLEKFNKENGLANYFTLLNVTRATMALDMYYHAEYTIQETICAKSKVDVTTDKCPIMKCEFAAADREKKLHLLGGETDHSHNDSHTHGHDHAHAADQTRSHDHVHNHTKSHTHDHVHAHHAKAHNHTGDSPNQHHDYKHADGVHTHEHDHELALDHDHKHAHLHEHEHHHHHHDHVHKTTADDNPEGMMMLMQACRMACSQGPDQVTTLPASPDGPTDSPKVRVTLLVGDNRRFPGSEEPTIKPFPTTVSAQCPPLGEGTTLVEKLFTEDPLFKSAA